ncbi:glycosyltransferase family 2 protein [Bacillus wiedmannii]|uniref:glycosyltransferase family 2 protein n=1 Tax=Bacillus wiedmannii TaxID=1890302 RepID=UPI003D97B7E2
MKPLVSIVLAIYNVEDYLEECLSTIVNQTIGIENLEVILVNDGSTDNTQKIIKKYVDLYSNFKVIHHTVPSGGCGGPRNDGIKVANGKYIIFADPDDLFYLDACESLVSVAEECNSDIVVGKFEQFNSKKRWENRIFKETLNTEKFNVSIGEFPHLLQAPFNMMAKVFRTSFVKMNNLLFFDGYISEDSAFTTKAFFLTDKISFIPQMIFKYRIRENEEQLSLSQRITPKYFSDFSAVRMDIYNTYQDFKTVNYYEIRYPTDISILIMQVEKIVHLSNEEKINIFEEIDWFIQLAKKSNISHLPEKRRDLVMLLLERQYQKAIEWINM